jgi:PhoH-like ATPase
MISERKNFILDTSVLLYDKRSIHSFPNSDVIIPIVVLDELDRFKDKQGILGEYARYVNRFLDDLRQQGSLHEGILLENDQKIRVEINHSNNVPAGLDPFAADNRIIAVAHELSKLNKKTTVITKDINFRVKCDALGIMAEDYYRDRVVRDENQIYSGQTQLAVDPEIIDNFFKNGKIHVNNFDQTLLPNQYVIAKSHAASFLGTVRGNYVTQLSCDLWSGIDVKARNKEQKFALDLLTRDDIPLVTMTGIAGSGKTFLALMAALSGLNQKRYERIIITRSLQSVGKEIGYLPGNIKEKMDPWISPMVDNFRHAFKDVTYFEMMRQKGEIEVAPMSFIRGRTFNNSFLIVDESQNSTIHELKTVITRTGENSKIVLIGDIEQIDTPYIDALSNGLTITIQKFKNEKLAGHISLVKGERSKLATLASRII